MCGLHMGEAIDYDTCFMSKVSTSAYDIACEWYYLRKTIVTTTTTWESNLEPCNYQANTLFYQLCIGANSKLQH